MSTQPLSVIEGKRSGNCPHPWHGSVEHAVNRAIRAGYRVGRRVRIGHIAGCVVGYNIGAKCYDRAKELFSKLVPLPFLLSQWIPDPDHRFSVP